jgi:hypothetical protein
VKNEGTATCPRFLYVYQFTVYNFSFFAQTVPLGTADAQLLAALNYRHFALFCFFEKKRFKTEPISVKI